MTTPDRFRKGRLTRFLAILASVLAAATPSVWQACEARPAPRRILAGVTVAGLDLEGMTDAQAEQALASFAADVVMQPVVLEHEQESWVLDPAEIGVHVLVRETVARALAVGRVGSLLRMWLERRAIATAGCEVPLLLEVDESRLRDYLVELASDIDVPAENAGLVINEDGTVTTRPAVVGRRLDLSELGRELREALVRRRDRRVMLRVETVEPSVSTEQVEAMRIRRRVASFATSFDPKSEARTHNIRAAAYAINGVLVAPGEEFSFNEAVGPRSEQLGYLEAPVVLEGDLVPGVGGGVCQVSSTLYNAVLLANLTVVARTNHSLVPAYVPAGRDATVAYDYIDFRFRNDGPGYVMLACDVGSSTLAISVYGDAPPDREVVIATKVHERIPPTVIRREDPSLPPGEEVVDDEGAWGCVVDVYRIVKSSGAVIATELISRDRYRARAKRVRVGADLVTTQKAAPGAAGARP